MLALTIALTVVVALLAVLVAGLLRSHADILRALHSAGIGVGDPAARAASAPPAVSVPLHIGPPLPGERASASAPDLSGVSPTGDAVAIAVTGVERFTLLAFLSSGCATCAGIWASLQDPVGAGFPADVRVVAVTKGPELEIPTEVARRSGGRITVVMSTQAWNDYEVPGSPFFALIDGRAGRRVGEGVANRADQIADLVRRAWEEERQDPMASPNSSSIGLDRQEREDRNDRMLQSVGILPGDASLYPGRGANAAGLANAAGSVVEEPTGPSGATETGAEG
jgi:hypothetical protein